MRILVTGCAGFIGFHTCHKLLSQGYSVLGVDSFNDYYDVAIKLQRAEILKTAGMSVIHGDLCDRSMIAYLAQYEPTHVIHLAAQSGVRHSVDHPRDYIQSNVVAFLEVLELCRHHGVKHLIYASSSSVYGAGDSKPLSLYAATKQAKESMAQSYNHLYGLNVTGLRFFTVYGPYGRPDMALYLFARAMMNGEPLTLYNNGEMWRDLTYVDDTVDAVFRLLNVHSGSVVFDVGAGNPVKMRDVVDILADALGVEPIIDAQPMHRADIPESKADPIPLNMITGWQPQVRIEEGIRRLVAHLRGEGCG